MKIIDHLKSRYLDTHIHTVWTNEDEIMAVFPLWNLSGQMVGYQQYRPTADKEKKNNPLFGRYFTRVKEGKVGVWGLESWNFSDTLFLTEGVFDACRLTSKGYSAIATCGNDCAPTTRSWVSIVRSIRKVVAVCDSDAAGRKLAKFGNQSHFVEGYNDLGDAADFYVDAVIREYS